MKKRSKGASIFGTNRPILGSEAEVGLNAPSGFGTEETGRSRPARGGVLCKVRLRRQER